MNPSNPLENLSRPGGPLKPEPPGATEIAGLLYSIANVLARHGLHLRLAKISTLGEHVEDTFLVSGAELQHNKKQIAIETELLAALQAG